MTYSPIYNETKAAHLAAYLLQKKDNGTMFLLKLMKLLYLVDKEALIKLGHTVTNDRYISMDYGPALGHTLDLMNGCVQDTRGVWDAMIAPRKCHQISIVDSFEVSYDSLSEAEIEIADEVFNQYGQMNRFDLAELTHAFPEWVNPNGSNCAITYEMILESAGYTSNVIESIISSLEDQNTIDNILDNEYICSQVTANAIA